MSSRRVVDLLGIYHEGPMPIEMSGHAFQAGAACAFGLLGMAEAIRDREWSCRCGYLNSEAPYYCTFCCARRGA